MDSLTSILRRTDNAAEFGDAHLQYLTTNAEELSSSSGVRRGNLSLSVKVLIHVENPKAEYGPVEDPHMIVDHLFYTWLVNRSPGEIAR